MPEATRGVVVALFAGLLLALTGCSNTVSGKDFEKKINKTLSAQVGQPVKAKCPGRLETKKGKTYDCTVVATDRSMTKVRLTMLDDSGKFSFRGAAGTTAPAE